MPILLTNDCPPMPPSDQEKGSGHGYVGTVENPLTGCICLFAHPTSSDTISCILPDGIQREPISSFIRESG